MRTKRAFKIKQKAFLIILRAIIEAEKKFSLEGDSPTLKTPQGGIFLSKFIRIFLVSKLECFIIKISTQWILRCWQYKYNYIDNTYLHTYLHIYLHLHSHIKISWNVVLLKKTNKRKLSGYCNKFKEWVER